ncbi:hypothetical protein PENSPDRAFT_650330 [Peniophora sp. CONT]|nr:hypothetical protein PENSPDRAFT_650330 [Peniophora sp. CONT]
MTSWWADIICRLPHAFNVLVSRARDVPLNLNVRQLEEINQAALFPIIDYALDHIVQARILDCPLFIEHCRGERPRESLTARAFPNLLSLNLSRAHYQVEIRPMANYGLITEVILHIDAPNLRTVTLDGMRCHFNSANLHSLQYLDCGKTTDIHGYLFQVLRDHPGLQSLRCRIDIDPSVSDHSLGLASGEVIEMPALKNLCAWNWLGGPYGDAARFFRHVSFPSTCTFHYSEMARPSDLQGWRKPFDLVGHRLRQLPYDAASIHVSDSWEVSTYHLNVFFANELDGPFDHFVAPYTGTSACCTKSDPGHTGGKFLAPGVRIEVEEPYVPEDEEVGGQGRWLFATVLPGIISYIHSETITHLALTKIEHNFRVWESDPSLVVALRPFTAVTTLFVLSVDNDTLQALVSGNIGTEGPVLPALRDLTVGLEVYWSTDLESSWNPQQCDAWWEPLLAFLEQRKHDEVPVRTLRLKGWWENESVRLRAAYEDDEHMQSARELVDEIIDDRTVDDVS